MLLAIPPKLISGTDTHAYYKNVFTEVEIRKILALPQWLNTNYATVGGTSNNNSNFVEKNIRRSNVSWIFPGEETNFIWDRLIEVIAEINNQFFHFDLTGCYEPIQLGIYDESENGHYDWHQDSSIKDKGAPRKLSMSLILSDESEYEGGKLQILENVKQEKTLETPKNTAWFFPSYTFHRVTPVTKGVRKSLVLWVGGPQFK
jgi:PKHD-type hydroxylase